MGLLKERDNISVKVFYGMKDTIGRWLKYTDRSQVILYMKKGVGVTKGGEEMKRMAKESG